MAIKQTHGQTQRKEGFQATVFKQKKGERIAAAIVPATVYGYTMQNRLNLFRSANSSLIDLVPFFGTV